MKTTKYRYILSICLFLLLFGGLTRLSSAQVKQDTLSINRSDTSQIEQKLNNQNKIIWQYNFDRSTHKYLNPESDRFNVPSPKEYYHPPIVAQQSLNAAMKVLRRQLENSITSSHFYQILTKIAPYINNVFVFGYYKKTVPVINRTNPYLYPQTIEGQAWRDLMINRHYDEGIQTE